MLKILKNVNPVFQTVTVANLIFNNKNNFKLAYSVLLTILGFQALTPLSQAAHANNAQLTVFNVRTRHSVNIVTQNFISVLIKTVYHVKPTVNTAPIT